MSADHVIAVMSKFAVDLDSAADCTAATAAVQSDKASIQTSVPEADQLEKLAADSLAMQWFQATYGARLATAREKVAKRALACKDDREFMAAFNEVNASPR
jgi:hypothetical protein